MVHEKYIKRGNKVFGPYLYENYRIKGVTKTRYLGVGKRKPSRSKFRVNAVFFILILLLLVALLIFASLSLRERDSEFLGELASKSPANFLIRLFVASSPVSVFLEIATNHPPKIVNTTENIFVCENKDVSYFFNVTDLDGDALELSYNVPAGVLNIIPLFFNPNPTKKGENLTRVQMRTRILTKPDINLNRIGNNGWAVYPEIIVVSDGNWTDSALFNLTIIEINNPPKFNLGTDTIEVYARGDNNFYYYDLGSYLSSRGEETLIDNLIFNVTFLTGEPFFNISNKGVINITGNESFISSGQNSTTYWVNVSVYDLGLTTLAHSNLNLCFPDDNLAKMWSDDFYLTITRKNRAPNITSHNPLNLSLVAIGADVLYFNITARDPDLNPVDVYWYADKTLKKYSEAVYENNFSAFEYSFGCGISGEHNVSVVVTDGLLNASLQWAINLSYAECPKPVPSGGGGGGSVGKLYCEEKWGCEDWKQCESLDKSVKGGWMSKEAEILIKERCGIFNYSGEYCGFQTRICTDFNYCKTEFDIPGILKECYYTKNPNCTDKIKNCHNGSCEVLTDCGGPCEACPTCSDKLQNQGEEKIDCGGPCKACVEIPLRPVLFKSVISYSLIALLILVLILVAREAINYLSSKKRSEKENIKKIIKQENKSYVSKAALIIFIVLLLFFANAYITEFIHLDNLASSASRVGENFLASYNFISGFVRSVGVFLTGGPFTNANTNLIIWDDTDFAIRKSWWDTSFFANYTDATTNEPLSSGACFIRFENYTGTYSNWMPMSYNLDGIFSYTRVFNYKGEYNFEVNCSLASSSVVGNDKFTITNSIPAIMEESGGGWISFDGNPVGRDAWQCAEDSVCYYNFRANITDADVNDILIYACGEENTTLTDYFLNLTSGLLMINVTNSSYAKQDRRIELKVQDSSHELWRSALLEVDIQEVNDAPIFVNLENKTFNALDLFEYLLNTADEEDNHPFKFEIEFLDCSNLLTRGNCTLFGYSIDETKGVVNISFIPVSSDIGTYAINFSVTDSSGLGNRTTSSIVSFTINRALWKEPVASDFVLIEDQIFYLNLSSNVTGGGITFSNGSAFPSFSVSAEGIIDFTPADEDVGYWEAKVIASDGETISTKNFRFNISNIYDRVFIQPVTPADIHNAVKDGENILAFENANINFDLYARDDDFKITQKEVYDEDLIFNLTIIGPNPSLFEFIKEGFETSNIVKYSAEFTPRNESVGGYILVVNITDRSNYADSKIFNLTIYERNYDYPIIHYPLESEEFYLKENVSSNLIFTANHTVGDNLTYEFYINNTFKHSLNYFGDGRNLSWNFTPNFTDETYGEKLSLRLSVSNPYFKDLNDSRIWNLTIEHTNAPPELIRDIGDKALPYTYALKFDLKDNFYDADNKDSHYNQNLTFIIKSNATLSYLTFSPILEDWTFVLSSSKFSTYAEKVNITAYDLNGTGGIVSQTTSNDFIIEFIEPPPTPVAVPVSSSGGGGGGGGGTVVSLKLIMPGKISAYEGEKIEIPISLVNAGEIDFNDISLKSSAFKDGNLSKEVNTSLSRVYFKSLAEGKKENLNLTVFFNTDKIGDYEILVEATSKSPVYSDWGKIHINLQKVNDSRIKEIVLFTQELIVENPQCIELREMVTEAERLFEQGEYAKAKLKTEEALDACRKAIEQVSIPKKKSGYLEISIYFALSILLAFVIGIAYYIFKRRKFQKIRLGEKAGSFNEPTN